MLVQTGEISSVFANGVVIAPGASECLGVELAACDIARNPCLAFIAAQIRVRIKCFLHAARGALRGAAAKQIRHDFYCNVGNRAGKREQREHPDPDLVAPGLNAMNDQQDLHRDREYEEPGHSGLTRREGAQAYWAAQAISNYRGLSRL